MRLVTALVAELQAADAAGLTACELEQFAAGRGREVLRQMVQYHLDLRAAREEETAREQRVPATGADGITRTQVETGHRRLLATLFGTVRMARCGWHGAGGTVRVAPPGGGQPGTMTPAACWLPCSGSRHSR
ncbi:MAG TPA: hypothetical protein VFQ68_05255 [Streptosporangiaceae bacterium]|nr:hypothetical protein [Streptosporangiaceae bacterium]